MFDEPGSLPMRAAMASFLGGLFGIAMILYTHVAQAQEQPSAERSARAVMILERLGDATLRSLRGGDSTAGGVAGMGGLRLRASASSSTAADAGGGLRWQAAPQRVLRSEIDNPRSSDQVSIGLQLRF